MNNLFDILNLKSKFGKQYEAPINLQKKKIMQILKNIYNMTLNF